MVGIYKITSPKGKIYIGQSTNVEDRILKYKYLNRSSIGPKLYNSLKKYGWGIHKFEIIELCDIISLPQKEKYWINHYKSIDEGLNIMEGGSTIGFKGGNTKKRMSEAWKNKTSEEMEDINKKRRKGNLGKSKPGAGCKFFTKEHRKKLSESTKGKSKIKKTSAKIKSTKSKVKSTQNAKSTIDSFEKKFRNKK